MHLFSYEIFMQEIFPQLSRTFCLKYFSFYEKPENDQYLTHVLHITHKEVRREIFNA